VLLEAKARSSQSCEVDSSLPTQGSISVRSPASAGGLFGQPLAAAPAVAACGFGQQQPAGGATGGIFGQPAAPAAAPDGFGVGKPTDGPPAGAVPPATGGFGFGQQPAPAPAPAPAHTGGLFGQNPAAPAAGGAGLGGFDQQQPVGGAAAGIFGQPAVPVPAAGLDGLGMFGKPQHQPQPAAVAGFGVFGKPVPSSPAAPTPISAPGGPAFDSLVLTLDESDAVRVAVEDAKNDPDEVARLRPTANVKVTVSAGFSSFTAPPLWHACSRDGGELKDVALLLLAGADIDGRSDGANWTPLHRASLDGMVDHVRLLLAWGGANLHAKCVNGFTPLQCAIRYGRVEIARLLREAGAVE
jgi:hypothetical protein